MTEIDDPNFRTIKRTYDDLLVDVINAELRTISNTNLRTLDERCDDLTNSIAARLLSIRREHERKTGSWTTNLGRGLLAGGGIAFFYELATGFSPVVWVGGLLFSGGLALEVRGALLLSRRNRALRIFWDLENRVDELRSTLQWYISRNNRPRS